ncbi:hypothetical protein [Heterosigma akashiwo virus 01]|jgi:hypothetical protein|uniref:Uncharacterized protein n=1 Tax=Heterosigma akashiwo virus 01 TaxID=97195 RepID=A0A1C9C506_HAV01|nr:hypothetical protein D1R72_gp033 [Heterosigma akashiwo virus 01]AOM63364.1 hypothetical protein [Heterosigma akashiwo virus 01]
MLFLRKLDTRDIVILLILFILTGVLTVIKIYILTVAMLETLRNIWLYKEKNKAIKYTDITFNSGDLIFFSYDKGPLSLADLYITRGAPLVLSLTGWYHVGLVIKDADGQLFITEFRKDVDETDKNRYGINVIITRLEERILLYRGIIGYRKFIRNGGLNSEEENEIRSRIAFIKESNIIAGTFGMNSSHINPQTSYEEMIETMKKRGLYCGAYVYALLYDTSVHISYPIFPFRFSKGNDSIWDKVSIINI